MGQAASPRRGGILQAARQTAVPVESFKIAKVGLVQYIVQDRLIAEDPELVRTLACSYHSDEVIHRPHAGCAIEPDHPRIARHDYFVMKIGVAKVKVAAEKPADPVVP